MRVERAYKAANTDDRQRGLNSNHTGVKRVPEIALVNMPFGLLFAPSIAFAQLRAAATRRLGGRISIRECHATFDAAAFVGGETAYGLAHSAQGFLSHFGEWFFSAAAFPDAPDNTEAYLARYYFDDSEESRLATYLARNLRPHVRGFLDSVIDRHCLLSADVVGFTLLFFQTTASLALARRIKERKPGTLMILGGPGCEGEIGLELLRRAPWIDYVFSGPALVSFPLFLERLLDTGGGSKCANGQGVFSGNDAWRSTASDAAGNSGMAMLGPQTDINDWQPLDYEPFLEQLAGARRMASRKPVLLFETSRGCWWMSKGGACSFCGLNNPQCGWQAMEPERALEYIQSLLRYAGRASCFVAVDSIMPRDYPEKVFGRLRASAAARFKYEVRPDLSGRDLDCLVAGGVAAVQPGIESLSTRTLRLMGKGLSAFDNLKFLRECTGRAISVEWNLLLFTPGEKQTTYETYIHIMPRLFHLPPPLAAYPVMFVRNSRYFRNPAKYGLKLRPHEFYEFIYPFGAQATENLAFFFVDGDFDSDWGDAWLDRINSVIGLWRQRWTGSDGKEPARLCFMPDDGALVYDSRSGRRLIHRLDATSADILHFLDRQADRKEIADRLAGRGCGEAMRSLRKLVELGLVFEEDGKLISLLGS